MTTDLAAIGIAAVFMFCGFGVLAGAGMLSGRFWATLGATGLAYMTGLVLLLVIGTILLVVGIAVTVPVLLVLSLVLGSAGFAVCVRHGRWQPPAALARISALGKAVHGDWGADGDAIWGWVRRHGMALVGGIAALVVAVWGYRWAQGTPLNTWDAFSIWARKGEALYYFGTPNLRIFAASQLGYIHPDYPLLLPLLESIWFRFVGSADTTSMHVEFWLFYLASLGAGAHIAARFAPARVWAPVIGFIAFVPAVTSQLMTAYADVPMGLLLMIGVLLLGVWVAERSRPHLFLGTLFLAGASSTKNEGLTFAVCALTVALILAAVSYREGAHRVPDLKLLGLAIAGFAVLILPWRIWLSSHSITGDIPIGKGLSPGYFFGRTDRLSPTLTAVYQQITNQGQWVWLLPLGAGLALGCLFTRRRTKLAAFYALTGIGVFALVVWAYVVGTDPLTWWLGTSASRTVDGIMFVSAAALIHLTAVVLGPVPKGKPPEPGREREAAVGRDERSDLEDTLPVGRQREWLAGDASPVMPLAQDSDAGG